MTRLECAEKALAQQQALWNADDKCKRQNIERLSNRLRKDAEAANALNRQLWQYIYDSEKQNARDHVERLMGQYGEENVVKVTEALINDLNGHHQRLLGHLLDDQFQGLRIIEDPWSVPNGNELPRLEAPYQLKALDETDDTVEVEHNSYSYEAPEEDEDMTEIVLVEHAFTEDEQMDSCDVA